MENTTVMLIPGYQKGFFEQIHTFQEYLIEDVGLKADDIEITKNWNARWRLKSFLNKAKKI